MARGIFTKQNGVWKKVNIPSVKDHTGAWKPLLGGFVKQNGVWRQFYPDNVIASVLIVGGGGGGGIGYGWEGGGGGGAGGVISFANSILSTLPGTTYLAIVGAGGGVNTAGSQTTFSSAPGFIALGGGAGGNGNGDTPPGGSGASGGGGSGYDYPHPGGSGTAGQG